MSGPRKRVLRLDLEKALTLSCDGRQTRIEREFNTDRQNECGQIPASHGAVSSWNLGELKAYE